MREGEHFLYSRPSTITYITGLSTTQTVLCGFAVAEAVCIIAQQFPSPLSTHLLSLLPSPDPTFRLTPRALLGCLLGAAGGALRVACHRALGQFFTWQVAVRKDHKLVTSGPYAIVRHPGYAAGAALAHGNTLLMFAPGSFFRGSGLADTLVGRVVVYGSLACLALTGMGLLRRMEKEDAVLKKEFGEEWEEWARKTPYKLIPWVY